MEKEEESGLAGGVKRGGGEEDEEDTEKGERVVVGSGAREGLVREVGVR